MVRGSRRRGRRSRDDLGRGRGGETSKDPVGEKKFVFTSFHHLSRSVGSAISAAGTSVRDELESVGEIMEGALMDMGLVMIEDDSEDNTDGENSTLDESTLESPAAYGGGGREGASGGGRRRARSGISRNGRTRSGREGFGSIVVVVSDAEDTLNSLTEMGGDTTTDGSTGFDSTTADADADWRTAEGSITVDGSTTVDESTRDVSVVEPLTVGRSLRSKIVCVPFTGDREGGSGGRGRRGMACFGRDESPETSSLKNPLKTKLKNKAAKTESILDSGDDAIVSMRSGIEGDNLAAVADLVRKDRRGGGSEIRKGGKGSGRSEKEHEEEVFGRDLYNLMPLSKLPSIVPVQTYTSTEENSFDIVNLDRYLSMDVHKRGNVEVEKSESLSIGSSELLAPSSAARSSGHPLVRSVMNQSDQSEDLRQHCHPKIESNQYSSQDRYSDFEDELKLLVKLSTDIEDAENKKRSFETGAGGAWGGSSNLLPGMYIEQEEDEQEDEQDDKQEDDKVEWTHPCLNEVEMVLRPGYLKPEEDIFDNNLEGDEEGQGVEIAFKETEASVGERVHIATGVSLRRLVVPAPSPLTISSRQMNNHGEGSDVVSAASAASVTPAVPAAVLTADSLSSWVMDRDEDPPAEGADEDESPQPCGEGKYGAESDGEMLKPTLRELELGPEPEPGPEHQPVPELEPEPELELEPSEKSSTSFRLRSLPDTVTAPEESTGSCYDGCEDEKKKRRDGDDARALYTVSTEEEEAEEEAGPMEAAPPPAQDGGGVAELQLLSPNSALLAAMDPSADLTFNGSTAEEEEGVEESLLLPAEKEEEEEAVGVADLLPPPSSGAERTRSWPTPSSSASGDRPPQLAAARGRAQTADNVSPSAGVGPSEVRLAVPDDEEGVNDSARRGRGRAFIGVRGRGRSLSIGVRRRARSLSIGRFRKRQAWSLTRADSPKIQEKREQKQESNRSLGDTALGTETTDADGDAEPKWTPPNDDTNSAAASVQQLLLRKPKSVFGLFRSKQHPKARDEEEIEADAMRSDDDGSTVGRAEETEADAVPSDDDGSTIGGVEETDSVPDNGVFSSRIYMSPTEVVNEIDTDIISTGPAQQMISVQSMHVTAEHKVENSPIHGDMEAVFPVRGEPNPKKNGIVNIKEKMEIVSGRTSPSVFTLDEQQTNIPTFETVGSIAPPFGKKNHEGVTTYSAMRKKKIKKFKNHYLRRAEQSGKHKRNSVTVRENQAAENTFGTESLHVDEPDLEEEFVSSDVGHRIFKKAAIELDTKNDYNADKEKKEENGTSGTPLLQNNQGVTSEDIEQRSDKREDNKPHNKSGASKKNMSGQYDEKHKEELSVLSTSFVTTTDIDSASAKVWEKKDESMKEYNTAPADSPILMKHTSSRKLEEKRKAPGISRVRCDDKNLQTIDSTISSITLGRVSNLLDAVFGAAPSSKQSAIRLQRTMERFQGREQVLIKTLEMKALEPDAHESQIRCNRATIGGSYVTLLSEQQMEGQHKKNFERTQQEVKQKKEPIENDVKVNTISMLVSNMSVTPEHMAMVKYKAPESDGSLLSLETPALENTDNSKNEKKKKKKGSKFFKSFMKRTKNKQDGYERE